ncbi:TolC family protein [Neisseria perflava]|uniref:TolC family protein n=1 Tax=Neisseria perflava TaxID=33053 RepID=UPI00209F72F6|nr:TolC family protein [Neisseria perflava]MCP1660642.1 NodT family efflux transporter outer membrane factor (OMF) lipoprotein [Neisseria perflava]MCP1771910.1 NodT family efflux transporter outer membrane factor (OMF) lipoprotein [Neisseria perflava]
MQKQSKQHFQTALALSVALALSACAINPKVGTVPTLDNSGAVMSAAQTAEQYEINGNWWEIYQSSQLNALEEQALANNIDLKQAAISVNKALYQANILGADLVPTFSGSLGASTSKNLKTGGSSSDSFSSQLGLSYELDLWQRLRATADAQVWEYRATQEDLANTRLTVVNNVADAYFNIAYINEAMALTQKSIKEYEEIARIVAVKYRYGKVDSSEVTSANQSLLSARNNLLSLQDSRNTLEQTLRNLLNLKPGEAIAAEPSTYRLLPVKGVDLNVPITVLANRPDLRAAELRVQSLLQTYAAQKRSWYPSVTLGATLSTSSSKARTMFNIPFIGGSASISLPFLDWPTLKWEDKTAAANYDNAKLDFEEALTTALNEVNTNYLAYQNSLAEQRNLEQRYQLDVKNSRYYKIRYEYGKNELKDWLEALNTQYSNAQNVLSQRYTTLKYENMVYKAMAGRYTPK